MNLCYATRHLTVPSSEHLEQSLTSYCIQKTLLLPAPITMYLPALINAWTTWLSRPCENGQHWLFKIATNTTSLYPLPHHFVHALGFENIMWKWEEIGRSKTFVLDWVSWFHDEMRSYLTFLNSRNLNIIEDWNKSIEIVCKNNFPWIVTHTVLLLMQL